MKIARKVWKARFILDYKIFLSILNCELPLIGSQKFVGALEGSFILFGTPRQGTETELSENRTSNPTV